MQSESKIRHRLKLLRFRYLEKELRKSASRNPCNCVYNSPVRVPKSKDVALYVCTHTERGFRETVCDTRHGGTALAARCPLFEPALEKAQVIEDFNTFWATASLPDFAERYPDAMALLWALDEADSRDIALPTDEEIQDVFGPDSLLNSLVEGAITVQEVAETAIVVMPSASGEQECWTPFRAINGFFDRFKWTEHG